VTSLWWRQVRGILRLELRKNLLSLRAVPIYLLALLPLAVVFIFVLIHTIVGEAPPELQGPAGAALFFAGLFQFILRFVIFFACVWTFMNLFRGEVLDRSLHYYFLAPVRREVLVAGKYLSAWTSVVLLFGAVTLVCFVVIYGYLGTGGALLGPAGHLTAYLGVVVLACLGYGAAFLVVGLFFRNPLVPAILFFLWEGINPLLPGLLKKISVIFYLQALFPVSISEGPLEFIVEPVSPWLSVPGLVLFTAATLFLAALRIRRMEVAYSSE
jgi:ABC-type transport system involved in multi-copper enzyme maturation permease subunit